MMEGKRLKVVSRILNRSASDAFMAWSEHIKSIKKQMARDGKRLKVISRILNRCVSVTWGLWRGVVQENKVMDHRKRQVISKLMSRCLVEAIERWADTARHGRRVRLRTQELLGASQVGLQRRCLLAWSEEASSQRQLLMRVSKSIQSWDVRAVRWAFMVWHRTARELATEENKIGKMLISWSRHREHSAFHTWAMHAQDQRGQRQRFQALLGANDVAVVGMAMEGWSETVREEKARLWKVTRIVSLSSAHSVRLGFHAWRGRHMRSCVVFRHLAKASLSRRLHMLAFAFWALNQVIWKRWAANASTVSLLFRQQGRTLSMFRLGRVVQRWKVFTFSKRRLQKDALGIQARGARRHLKLVGNFFML